MLFCGQPGTQVMYDRKVNAVAKITLPAGVAANATATIALADIGLDSGLWTYAEQFSGWEETNLVTKDNFHVCAIVGTDLVITEGADTWTDGEVLYVRMSRFPLIGSTPTMS